MITISGNDASRVINMYSGANLTLDGLTITLGRAGNAGLITNNAGKLTINDSTFSHGVATNTSNSTGGIYALAGSTTTISGSTISDNSGSRGAGIFINGTGNTLTLINSTVTGNSSTARGGGLYVAGGNTAKIVNSTFSANYSTGGGALYAAGSSTVTIYNSILANSTGTGGDCSAVATATLAIRNTLIRDGSCGISGGFGTNNVAGNPQLLTLTGNPAYYPLNTTSPAVNRGDNTRALDANGDTLTEDQAKQARIADFVVDMGAYEANSVPVVWISPASVSLNEGASTDVTITRGGNAASSLVVVVSVTNGTDTTSADYSLSGALTSPIISGHQYGLTFAAGEFTKVITIDALVDSVGAEPDDTVTFALSGGAYAVGTPSSSVVTIPANDLQVRNDNDSGDGSLRQAILNANSFGGSNTITFSTYFNSGRTITLGSDLPSITGTVIIDGPGFNVLMVSGAGMYRPFTVSGSGDLTLDNLTIANGYVNNSQGGAVFNSGTLTVTHSVFAINLTTGTNSYGGAISSSGTLTVSNTSFYGNTAQYYPGGAIASSGGTVTVTDSIFGSNTSSNSSGGAIYVNGGTLSLTSSTLTGNTVRLAAASSTTAARSRWSTAR